MSNNQKGILAIFSYLDDFCNAIKMTRERSDCAGHEFLSPTSYHEIEEAAGFGASPVRFYTLTGALTGLVSGFALCLFMDSVYPIVVGGKTPGIASFPAYVIIMFELTILLGAIATIIGILWEGRVPNPNARILDKRITDDKFAIYIPGAKVDGPQAQFLRDCGAEELQTV